MERHHRTFARGYGRWMCKSRLRGKCVGWIAIVQDHQKLLTAVAAYEIIRSHGREQPFRCFPQDIITSEMAVGIIHTLEVIQIAQPARTKVSWSRRRDIISSSAMRILINAPLPCRRLAEAIESGCPSRRLQTRLETPTLARCVPSAPGVPLQLQPGRLPGSRAFPYRRSCNGSRSLSARASSSPWS